METTAKVFRLEQSDQGALGAMLLHGWYFGSTLEPDSNDPERSQIPPGTYLCQRRIAPKAKYKNTFEIIVPGHTAVLFHWGNKEANTKMCVIVGKYPGQLDGVRAVLASKATFDLFMSELEGIDRFYIEFINLF